MMRTAPLSIHSYLITWVSIALVKKFVNCLSEKNKCFFEIFSYLCIQKNRVIVGTAVLGGPQTPVAKQQRTVREAGPYILYG